MAKSRIAGITVEIGGDTTKLQSALKDTNSAIKTTQSELKDVNKLLKLDPTNTELLSQKQKLLKTAIEETSNKLTALKEAEKQAATEVGQKGKISQEQYQALCREIVATEQELKNLTKESMSANAKLASIADVTGKVGEGAQSIGRNMSKGSAAIVGLGAAAVKTTADFESSMSNVAAISGATGEDLEALKSKAREMGSQTKFSATEAGDAFGYMAMAGWKTSDMIDGISGIMNLAAASGEDLATTSDIVTDALTAFGLKAEDSGHFADVLAAASSNANTNVSMMGETFKYAAPIAGALGYSVEDTAEAIGLMANSGIKASQAGTTLRKIMTSLTGDIEIEGNELGKVTIATTNADGSMRGLSYILSDCREAFGHLSESEKSSAASSLVGTEAMSGFLALMNAAPSDIEKLSGAINNCDGTAENMAATMQDNLSGQITTLKSQLQELAISMGELLMPTDFANSVVSVIGDAQITSAMIKDLAFDKITGIDINTTVMNVHSEDGKSTWKDNTIQISDKDRVRIQLGKDAAGDYNIYIWDKDGKLMFDPLYGVQEAGIKKAIIRNDMVSDNAAISGKKLDIDSVFSVMNADKSNTFNASKIHVDTTDQTLESTFQTINNYVSGGSDAWGSTMLQAKTFIEHKLWWTDIDEEGNSVKSKFNDVKTTLDSFKIDMSDVTKQLNGTFEIYDITEVPTLDNYPATEFFVKVYPAEDWYPLETDTWQYTQEEYAKHAGAVAYMKSSNRAWKFLKQSSGTYGWTEISASETAYMLNKHAAFQVAIDGITAEVSRVKVDIKDNYITTESAKSLISQSEESITSSISKTYTTMTDFTDGINSTKEYADGVASAAQSAAEGTAANALTDALKNYTVTKDMESAIKLSADSVKTYVSETYKRIGGDFNAYTVSEIPTLDNYPATEFFVPVYPAEDWYPLETDTWQYNDSAYALHVGAIAYNPTANKTWRFTKKDDAWVWEEISNTETAYMLNRFARHDVAVDNITGELTSVRKDLVNNYSTTTEMVNRIVQEIKDDKSTISSSLQATYATQKYADDAANAATSGANNYTDNALKTYSTTADIIQAISPGETSISAAVTAKLGDYATSASLKALIENKDGQLKSAIEAIADTINITAKGGLNLSGNRIAIDSDNFTLTEDGRITKCKNIIVDGGTVGGWKIGDKSIYSSYDYNDVTYDVSLHKAEKPSTHILQVTKEKNNLFDYTFFITAEGKMCSYGQLQESGNTFNSEACLFGGYLKMLDTTNNTYTLIHPHGIHARNKENINTLTLVSNSDDGSGDGLIITGSAGTEVSVLRDSITLWYQPNSQKYTKIGKGYVRICNNNTNYYKDCALSVIGGIKTDSFKLYNQNIGWCGAALNRTSDNDISFGWDGTYLRIYIDNTIIASYKYSPGNSEWV